MGGWWFVGFENGFGLDLRQFLPYVQTTDLCLLRGLPYLLDVGVDVVYASYDSLQTMRDAAAQ